MTGPGLVLAVAAGVALPVAAVGLWVVHRRRRAAGAPAVEAPSTPEPSLSELPAGEPPPSTTENGEDSLAPSGAPVVDLDRRVIRVQRDTTKPAAGRFLVHTPKGPLSPERYAVRLLGDEGATVHMAGNAFWKRLASVVAVDELKGIQGLDSIGDLMMQMRSPTKLKQIVGAARMESFERNLRRVGSFQALVEENWEEFVLCNPGFRPGFLDPAAELERLLTVVRVLEASFSPRQLAGILERVYRMAGRTVHGLPELLVLRDGQATLAAVQPPGQDLDEEKQALLGVLVGELDLPICLLVFEEESTPSA